MYQLTLENTDLVALVFPTPFDSRQGRNIVSGVSLYLNWNTQFPKFSFWCKSREQALRSCSDLTPEVVHLDAGQIKKVSKYISLLRGPLLSEKKWAISIYYDLFTPIPFGRATESTICVFKMQVHGKSQKESVIDQVTNQPSWHTGETEVIES
ncbi:hypothetical protein [Epibacterium ulvae]|uniref:hypothetical protein n=1 Tax=Epibacterium ulvae TaxID=1156985 RepID=UPI002491F343|nr:hypothetical protein [Epibacterium ulvae]